MLAGLLAGAWGRPNTVAAAALTAATAAAVVAAAAAAVAVPLAVLLVASEAADPLARGSPAHINGFLIYSLVLIKQSCTRFPFLYVLKQINRN